jgi:hypothetical protein
MPAGVLGEWENIHLTGADVMAVPRSEALAYRFLQNAINKSYSSGDEKKEAATPVDIPYKMLTGGRG